MHARVTTVSHIYGGPSRKQLRRKAADAAVAVEKSTPPRPAGAHVVYQSFTHTQSR